MIHESEEVVLVTLCSCLILPVLPFFSSMYT